MVLPWYADTSRSRRAVRDTGFEAAAFDLVEGRAVDEASSTRRSSRGERVYGTRIHVKPVLSHGLDVKDVELLVPRQELRMRLVSRAGLWSPR